MKKIVPSNAVLIPRHAKRVFKGEIFEVYQWPQEMFDGSIKTFEMVRRPDTVATIAVIEDKIIVLEEEQPNLPTYYSIPIGRHDVAGETPLQGAQRELAEEAGLYFKNWKLITVRQITSKVEWFLYLYVATGLVKEVTNTPENDGEKITVMRKTFEETKQLANHSRNRHIPRDLFENVQSLEDLLAIPVFEGKEVTITP